MTALRTARLDLLPLSVELAERRLATTEPFDLTMRTTDGEASVHVGADWPLDVGPLLPMFLEDLRAGRGVDLWSVVERTTGDTVGDCGTKGGPGGDGSVEIGYGFVPPGRGRGVATEAVAALTGHLLGRAEVTTVRAETVAGNRASERVLEKCRFAPVGARHDATDGDLTVWARS